MLQGEYRHTIDAKGRFFFPAPLKEEIGTNPTICRGLDKNLWVFAETDWKAFTDKIAALPYADSRKMRYFFVAKSQTASVDAQGRLVVPQFMREHAGLQKNIVIVGALDRVEIWDESNWDHETGATSSEDILEIMEKYEF